MSVHVTEDQTWRGAYSPFYRALPNVFKASIVNNLFYIIYILPKNFSCVNIYNTKKLRFFLYKEY